jgi:hypothetical protein
VRRLVGHIHTLELDPPGALLDQADNGTERRRLAGAVAAEQRDDLAIADLERDIEQDMRRAIMAVEVLNGELHAESPLGWRAS